MHKADSTAKDIIAALKKLGYSVEAIQGVEHLWGSKPGVPDLLVAKDNQMWLLEVKRPGGRVSDAQKAWAEAWQAPVYVVHSPEEALRAVGLTVGG